MLFVTSHHPRQQILMINVKQNTFLVKNNPVEYFRTNSQIYCDKSLIYKQCIYMYKVSVFVLAPALGKLSVWILYFGKRLQLLSEEEEEKEEEKPLP